MSIRSKLLIIASVCLLIAFFAFMYQEYNAQNQLLTLNIENTLDNIQDDFYLQIDRDLRVLSATRDMFIRNANLKNIYLQQDREQLYQYTHPIYNELKAKYGITDICFQLPDSRTFLRVHNKDIYNDLTDRITFRIAQITKETSEGLEVGKTGFALRVVGPYYNKHELIGYVEFGQKIDHFLKDMKAEHDLINNIAIVVNKEYISHEDWKSECSASNHSDTWDAFEDYVIVASLNNDFKNMIPFIDKNYMDLIDDQSHILKSTSYNKNPFSIGTFPLYRADNKIVGAIICNLDTSKYVAIQKATLRAQIIVFSLILVVFMAFIYHTINHSFIKPIFELATTAQHIAADGDLSVRSAISSNDEIGCLANAFNKMTDDLSNKTVNKRYLDEIFHSMVDPLLVTDTHGIITRTNKTTCDLLEYSSEDIIGRHISEILEDPEVTSRIMDLLKYNSAKTITAQCMYTTSKHDLIPMYISCSILSNAYNQVNGLIINGKDMIDLTRIEVLLHNEKEFLQHVIDAIPAPIFVKNIEGVYKGCNQAFESFSGLPKEDILEHTVYDVIPKEKADIFNDMDVSMFVDPKTRSFERTVKFPDNSMHDVVFHKSPYWTNSGDLAGLVGVIFDITQLKRAEQELRKFKVLSDNANYGVTIINTDGCIQYINNYMASIHGYNATDLLGHNIRIFFDAKQYEIYQNIQSKLLHEGNLKTDELWHTKCDGSAFPVLSNFVVIKDELDRALFITMTAMDITEERKMKEELLKAVKLESIGLLAGGIGHDFNNLLTAILGNVAMAQMDIPTDNPVSELLTNIENASKRAQDLSQQLLTFSKGGAPIKQTTSIETIIKDSVAFTVKGTNAKCEFDFPDHLNSVNVDKGQISQVINNLVVNAIQAMPKGGTITVACKNLTVSTEHPELKQGNYVHISVKDQGQGISKQQIEKIFDPYFTTKKHGSGLGLATCYSIIKKHNGHISVESESGEGACFNIYLPSDARQICKTQIPTKQDSIVSGQGKILIMDDEDIVRHTIGQIVKRLGYEVSYAVDGVEAINLYRKAFESGTPFAAVIMDLTIPGGMGGKDTIKELHRIDPNVCAVVASGYCNDPVMSNHKKYGFRSVVKKPVSIQDLSASLHEALTSIPII